MQKYSRVNKGYKYIFTNIDTKMNVIELWLKKFYLIKKDHGEHML